MIFASGECFTTCSVTDFTIPALIPIYDVRTGGFGVVVGRTRQTGVESADGGCLPNVECFSLGNTFLDVQQDDLIDEIAAGQYIGACSTYVSCSYYGYFHGKYVFMLSVLFPFADGLVRRPCMDVFFSRSFSDGLRRVSVRRRTGIMRRHTKLINGGGLLKRTSRKNLLKPKVPSKRKTRREGTGK